MIVVLMGVTGTGKTTVAHELVLLTGWLFAEGDDYHGEANRAKMHAGIPLTDEDRRPWLASLHAVLMGWHQQGRSGVLTCSALKQAYRETLSAGIPAEELKFVVLTAQKELIAERLAGRQGHYMNPALLDSQLATLEDPKDAIHVDATPAPHEIAISIMQKLKVSPSLAGQTEHAAV